MKLLKNYIEDILFLLGTLLAAFGMYQIYKPSAFLFVGIVFMVIGVLTSRRR
jgi:hypothetical protein